MVRPGRSWITLSNGSGGLEGPHGLVVGPDGNLYVANRFHRSVLRYDGQTGAFIDAFVPSAASGGLDIPIGLVFGPDGNLYVSSYGTDQVLRYDGRTGAFLDAFVPPDRPGCANRTRCCLAQTVTFTCAARERTASSSLMGGPAALSICSSRPAAVG